MSAIDEMEKQARDIRARRQDMQRLLGRYHAELARLQDMPGAKGALQRHRLQADIAALRERLDVLARDLAGIEQGAMAPRAKGGRRIAA